MRAIRKFDIRSLHFLGGEPTLYIAQTNSMLEELSPLARYTIRITTNGHFATNKTAAVSVLSSYLRLNAVELSYDRFHEQFLPFRNVRNLQTACASLGVKFGVVAAIQSPLDLIWLDKLRSLGNFPVGIQKVLPIGSAEKNGVAYQHPVFDRSVLRKFCPNRRVLTYMPRKGFSVCCSSLVYGKYGAVAAHPDLQTYLGSKFYRLITGTNFKDIISRSGLRDISFSPQDSSPCVLCEKIFRKMGPEGRRRLFGGSCG